MDDDLRLELARLLRDTAPVAMRWFRQAAPDYKADGSPVTQADRAVEEQLVGALERAFPQDGIVSEEGGRSSGTSGYTWFVDPIDGTGAFVQGLAYWGPAVCRVRGDGQVHTGGLYLPRLDETWTALRGGGAWRDDVRLPAMPRRPLRRNDIAFVPSRFHMAPRAPWPGKIRVLGSTAAHLALVAGGAGLAAVVHTYSPWDVGGGLLMIREVGGVIWGASGTETDPLGGQGGLPFLAGAPTALEAFSRDGWAERVLRPRP